MKKEKTALPQNQHSAVSNASADCAAARVNTHFVLAVVAVCLSCFTGFFAVPLAIAALIFSLRTQDQLTQEKWTDARQSAFWAGLFGWLTVAIVILPILLFIFFGGAILALFGGLIHTFGA